MNVIMLISRYLTPNTVIELVCLLLAIICLAGLKKDKVWQVMIIYLFITCAAEFMAIYLKKLHHYNQWPYNFSIIFEASCISLMFHTLLKKYFNSKPLLIGGLVLLFVIYSYDVWSHHFLLITDTMHDLLNDTTNDVMYVLFSLYAFIYFYVILKDDQYIDLKFSAEFWWVFGVLFFYFGNTALNLFRTATSSEVPNQITTGLIWMLYGCWIYSFFCKRWLTKTSDV